MAMGRPRKPFDWDKLDAILQFKASLLDACDIMDVSEDTMALRIREKYDMTFTEYRNKKMSKTRYNIAKKQYDVAMNGNVSMLIWLGKQWLGQEDKNRVDVGKTITVEGAIKEAEEKLKIKADDRKAKKS